MKTNWSGRSQNMGRPAAGDNVRGTDSGGSGPDKPVPASFCFNSASLAPSASMPSTQPSVYRYMPSSRFVSSSCPQHFHLLGPS